MDYLMHSPFLDWLRVWTNDEFLWVDWGSRFSLNLNLGKEQVVEKVAQYALFYFIQRNPKKPKK